MNKLYYAFSGAIVSLLICTGAIIAVPHSTLPASDKTASQTGNNVVNQDQALNVIVPVYYKVNSDDIADFIKKGIVSFDNFNLFLFEKAQADDKKPTDGKNTGDGGDTSTSDFKIASLPVDNSGYRVTSSYGPRVNPLDGKTNEDHDGIDLAWDNCNGTKIMAVQAGTVKSSFNDSKGGNTVVIDHGNNVETTYCHLGTISTGLKAGDSVTAGQTIGTMGNTGTESTGPHLHFAVKVNGNAVNPLPILKALS